MNLKTEYTSTNNGVMFSCWPGGALGRGCNRLVIDDPHPPGDAWSEAGRESTLKFCRGSLFSRLDHPATDSILVCHSRLHEDDLIGVLCDPDRDRGDRKNPKDHEEVGGPSALPPDPLPPSTAMDASRASEPYRPPLRYNPWVCGYTR